MMRYKTKFLGDGQYAIMEEFFGQVVDEGPYDYATALRKSDIRNEELVKKRLGR